VRAISVCPAAVRETGFQREAGMQRTTIFRDLLATTPDVVASDIHRALRSGRRVVVSGRAMRWVLPLAELLPRWLQDQYLLARYRRELSAATRNRD
jgi:short-subunit dehydrogenase